jgi:hypothetical protein
LIALVGQGTSLPERTAKVVDKDGLQESFLKHGIMLYTVTERLTRNYLYHLHQSRGKKK